MVSGFGSMLIVWALIVTIFPTNTFVKNANRDVLRSRRLLHCNYGRKRNYLTHQIPQAIHHLVQVRYHLSDFCIHFISGNICKNKSFIVWFFIQSSNVHKSLRLPTYVVSMIKPLLFCICEHCLTTSYKLLRSRLIH